MNITFAWMYQLNLLLSEAFEMFTAHNKTFSDWLEGTYACVLIAITNRSLEPCIFFFFLFVIV